MTLHQLELFLAVCEKGSLTAAAESLHISQPSISVAIKQLEEELGLNLFFRYRKRMILTDEGKDFQLRSSEIVDSVGTLKDYMKNLQRHQSVIRLGISIMAGLYPYPKLLAAFCGQYPSISIESRERSTENSIRLLRENKLDLAIVVYDETLLDLFEFTPLLRTSLVGCVREDHRLAHRTGVTPEMLRSEKLVLGGQHGKTSQLVTQRFADAGVEPNVFMRSYQVLFEMEIIREYNAVSFFIEELTNKGDRLAPFYLDPPIPFTYGFIRRKDVLLSNDALCFLKFCKDFDFSGR